MIRRATIKDVNLLQELGRKTFDDTFGGTCTKADMQYVLDKYFNTEQCRRELQDEKDHYYFWEEEGIAKGYIRMNEKNEYPIEELKAYRCVELVRCYVLKKYHGSQVSAQLMKHAFEYARAAGYQKIYLSVWEYNFRARGFYEKHGFKNTGIENDFPLGSTPQTDYWFVKDV